MFVLEALLACGLIQPQDPPPRDLTISGRVVDAQQRPVEGVEITCSAAGSNFGNLTETGSDGSFLFATEGKPLYQLEVDARGLTDKDMPRVVPGAHELEIVLPPRAFQTFRVLDDASGKPIELAEIHAQARDVQIEWASFPEAESARYRAAPGGELLVPIGRNPAVCVTRAPGCAPLVAQVRDDLAPLAVQELRVRAGARLLLRLVGESGVIAGARAELCCFDWNKPTLPGELPPGRWIPFGCSAISDAQGRIEIGELFGGEHWLHVRAAGLTPFDLHGLRIEPGATRDLGEIRLGLGASLSGRVTALPGEDLTSITLLHDIERGYERVQIAADGNFRITGLEPGETVLLLPEQDRAAVTARRMSWKLGADESKWVLLDLAAHWPRPLRVSVLDMGHGLEGVQVCGRGREPRSSRWIGATDTGGTLVGLIEPGPGVRMVLTNREGLELDDRALDPGLAPGTAVEERFELATGTGQLAFDAQFLVPQDVRVRVELVRADRPAAQASRIFLGTGGYMRLEHLPRLEGHAIDLGRLSQAEYSAEVVFEVPQIELGRPISYHTLPERFHAKLRVKAGEVTVARLEREP